MSRVKSQDRTHIVYELTIGGLTYIGCTNVEARLGIEGSLARRIAKHWYRLKDERRKDWALYRAIATLPTREHIGRRILALADNKQAGHDLETQLIAQHKPALNSDQ